MDTDRGEEDLGARGNTIMIRFGKIDTKPFGSRRLKEVIGEFVKVRPSVAALSHQTLVDVLMYESSRAGNGEHENGCMRYKAYTTDVDLHSQILYFVKSVGECFLNQQVDVSNFFLLGSQLKKAAKKM